MPGDTAPILVDDARAAELTAIVGSQCPEPETPLPPYGTRTVTVDARTAWQATGLYLRQNERAHIEADGSWTIWKDRVPPFGPEGSAGLSSYDGCRKGELVAKIGLSPTTAKYCLGASADLVAGSEGIVYLAMNDNSALSYHSGTASVTITSDGNSVPEVQTADAGSYDFCAARSGWVELRGGGPVLVTVPAALADKQRATVQASMAKLDRIYQLAEELAGGEAPFLGQPLRLYPDFDVRTRGWMVAGNPLLMDPKNLNAVTPSRMRLLDLDADGSRLFDLVRALGVDFSRQRGARYQMDDAAAQAWGGLFALYVAEKEAIGDLPAVPCQNQAKQASGGDSAGFLQDPWLQLCLLSNFQKAYGWPAVTRFFQALPAGEAWDSELPAGSAPAKVWAWIAARLSAAAGTDISPLLKAFKVPGI